MKKLLYTLLAVSIIFSACKKEDEEPNNTGNNNTGNNTTSIVGIWDLKYYEYDSYYINSLNPTDTTHNSGTNYYTGVTSDCCWPFYLLEFQSNNEVKITTFTEGYQGQDSVITEFAAYHINGVNLNIYNEEWQTHSTPPIISLLNNNNLHLTQDYFVTQNGNGTETETYYGTTKYFFERIN